MFGQAAAFEHVAKLLLAPPPARLGGVAQRIDQLGGFGRDALGARLHRLDMAGEQAEVLAPVLLDLADDFLIALEAVVDRLEHGGERLARGRLAFLEALVGALEELLLRAFEQLPADFGELRAERLPWRAVVLLRGDHLAWRARVLPARARRRGERARACSVRSVSSARACSPRSASIDAGMGIALLAHRVELEPQRIPPPPAPPRCRAIRAASRASAPSASAAMTNSIAVASKRPSSSGTKCEPNGDFGLAQGSAAQAVAARQARPASTARCDPIVIDRGPPSAVTLGRDACALALALSSAMTGDENQPDCEQDAERNEDRHRRVCRAPG